MAEGIRIIGGEAGGRYIKTFKNDLSVRPLLGRIKKSIFDILAAKLPGLLFLDLYAGTGAVGIEALSRGAKKAVFVDGDRRCAKLIEQNLAELGWTGRAKVEQHDITRGLGWLDGKFGIVYMGPPYKDSQKKPLNLTGITLKIVFESGVLDDNGWIISQRHIKEPVEAPAQLMAFRQEKYGDTIVVFYRKAE
ncbi:MAG: 16S rRNA (guanine(966)-N(2))-methyltransferase RsmD [Elusimicrobiota bacterium]